MILLSKISDKINYITDTKVQFIKKTLWKVNNQLLQTNSEYNITEQIVQSDTTVDPYRATVTAMAQIHRT